MKGTRHQKGYLYKKGNLWMIRYYDQRGIAGRNDCTACKKRTNSSKLIGDYRTKEAARVLGRGISLRHLNDRRATPHSMMSLRVLSKANICRRWNSRSVSALSGYRDIWRRYLKPHGAIALRDFRTPGRRAHPRRHRPGARPEQHYAPATSRRFSPASSATPSGWE